MISVTAAQKKILETISVSKSQTIAVSDAGGFVSASDILSPLDLPPFDQSAMDGYAVLSADVQNGKKISVRGESSAGKSFLKKIKRGEAVRIFTGAEIPGGADAVIMQEKVSLQQDVLHADELVFSPGLNIRTKGSQIKKGQTALNKDTIVTPAGIGFLTSMGLTKLRVYSKPSVAVIITGNELVEPGKRLSRGKIFESNSAMLASALKESDAGELEFFFAEDDEQQTRTIFLKAMERFDFILFTGGISVGDYDFVGRVLTLENVKEIFYKVKQKPGKPLYFGTKNNRYIFGLPGNPASVLTCFYEYVLPSLRKFSGHRQCFLPEIKLPLAEEIRKKPGLTHFLKAVTDLRSVTALTGQESYILRSYSEANCLIVLPEDCVTVKKNERVTVHLLGM